MIKLLVVDDESLNLRIIQESLEESGYVLEMSTSGEEAMRILESENSKFSAIILDRLMPGMDGIEVLKNIKKDPRYQDVPVILQTALGNNENVVEGLEAGAFYYLTKPYSKKVLVSIIHLAVENFSKFSQAKEQLNRNRSISNYFREGTFSIKTFGDVLEIAPVICNAFPNPRRALTGTIELLNNAIEHGNLEIGFNDKKRLLSENRYDAHIQSLLSTSPYKNRQVLIHILKTDSNTVMTITDEGKGFDHKNMLCNKKLADNLFLTNGRGILIARSACFDKLEYMGSGNIVRVESYKDTI